MDYYVKEQEILFKEVLLLRFIFLLTEGIHSVLIGTNLLSSVSNIKYS